MSYDELYFGGETMDILYVILTALLVVAAVTMILKKVDTRLTFLFLGVIPASTPYIRGQRNEKNG